MATTSEKANGGNIVDADIVNNIAVITCFFIKCSIERTIKLICCSVVMALMQVKISFLKY